MVLQIAFFQRPSHMQPYPARQCISVRIDKNNIKLLHIKTINDFLFEDVKISSLNFRKLKLQLTSNKLTS